MKITIMAVKTAGNAKKGITASGVALVDVKTGETVANAYIRSGGAEGDESKSIAALDDNLQRVARINNHLLKSTISTYTRTRLLSLKIKECDTIFRGEPIDSNAIMSTDWVEVASEAAAAAVAYTIRRLKRELTAARKAANEVAMREIAKQGYKA